MVRVVSSGECITRFDLDPREGSYRPNSGQARLTSSPQVKPVMHTHRLRPRVADLREVTAAVRSLSCEPLLGPLTGLDLTGIGAVIAGGDSGAHAQPVQPMWITGLRDTCAAVGVPYFFKQWGGRTPKAGVETNPPSSITPASSHRRTNPTAGNVPNHSQM